MVFPVAASMSGGHLAHTGHPVSITISFLAFHNYVAYPNIQNTGAQMKNTVLPNFVDLKLRLCEHDNIFQREKYCFLE